MCLAGAFREPRPAARTFQFSRRSRTRANAVSSTSCSSATVSRSSADRHPGQMLRFEPLTLHAALATQTSRVGLVATASTTYSAPFNIARMFASLDKLSGGRAGWNVVTTGMPEAAGNFGSAGPMEHATRYESATEFVEVVQGLWDSWEEGAITTNAETGEYFDKTKVHSLDHVGKFYSVRGPLNVTRTPQGQPVLVQAGASEDGQKFASRFAEMIFAVSTRQGACQGILRNDEGQGCRLGPQSGPLQNSSWLYADRWPRRARTHERSFRS